MVFSIKSVHLSVFILFLFYLFFNWRIIALQNVAVFCQTSTWISHRYTYIPLSWTSLPSPHPAPLGWYRAPVGQRSHVVSGFFIVFCVRAITERKVFEPLRMAVPCFISQILHVKNMYYLGVLMDGRVCHRFVVMIFNIKSFVSWITSCSCPSSSGNCCDPSNSSAVSKTSDRTLSTSCLAWTVSVMLQQVYVLGYWPQAATTAGSFWFDLTLFCLCSSHVLWKSQLCISGVRSSHCRLTFLPVPHNNWLPTHSPLTFTNIIFLKFHFAFHIMSTCMSKLIMCLGKVKFLKQSLLSKTLSVAHT